MKSLPINLKAYKRTAAYDQDNIPQGFLNNHNTKENVWALIHVIEGELEYTIDPYEPTILKPGKNGVVEPKIMHRIRPLGKVSFFLEFYK